MCVNDGGHKHSKLGKTIYAVASPSDLIVMDIKHDMTLKSQEHASIKKSYSIPFLVKVEPHFTSLA